MCQPARHMALRHCKNTAPSKADGSLLNALPRAIPGAVTAMIRFLNSVFMKRIILSLTLFIAGFGLLSFVDSYFELSKNLDLFSSVYREVTLNYVDETDPADLVKTGIDAMLSSLDPYTNFIAESDIEDFRFMTTHEYGGIGALIGSHNGQIVITEPYEKSPADKAGLKAGDIVLEVAGEKAEGKSSGQLSDMLRGAVGTSVALRVLRQATGAELELNIVRDNIKLDDVPFYTLLPDKTGYISLNGFTESASGAVKSAFDDLKSQGMTHLVIDLRGNGGGLLREAVNIVNFFVPQGETVVEVKGRLKEHYSLNKALRNPIDLEIPLAVLIDEGSASASEIVAGTLQDLDRAVVVGRNSFGKGLVQSTQDLSYNSKLKLTIAKYYTPSGRCIQRIDYGHRDERGKASAFPDSLLRTFSTRAGRLVSDGQGIEPDLLVEESSYSDLLGSLLNANLIFAFATEYYYSHPAIAPAREFALTETEYAQFVEFALSREFEYKTAAQEQLNELKNTLTEGQFYAEVNTEFEALSLKLNRDKRNDLMKFKDEVSLVLQSEIASRYYYSKGRLEAYLTHDPDLTKAVEVLHNNAMRASVFDGTCAECRIKKG